MPSSKQNGPVLLAEVKVWKRTKRAPDDTDVERFPFQADIVYGLDDHHGVGATPAQALLRAAAHWDAYFDARDVDVAY